MLEKIVQIKNVGVFEDYSAPGSAKFSDATLIFAGNSRGKTTISAILRSLSEHDVDLKGRERLGADGSCSVFVRSDTANHRYAPHAWDTLLTKIDVFDEEFIHTNVHSGYFVDRGHKRGLYQVVVGSKGTRLAQKVNEIDEGIAQINTELRKQREKLTQVIKGDLAVDDFAALSEVEEIDKRIESTRKELQLAEREEEVKNASPLNQVTVPALPENSAELLGRSLEAVSQAAVDRVKGHIDNRLGPDGEPWVQKGLDYAKDDNCPFCDQGLEGVELIDSYRTYFSSEYRSLQEDVASTVGEIAEVLGEKSLQSLREDLEKCRDRREYWDEIAEIEIEVPDPNSLIPRLRGGKTKLLELLEEKQGAPLEKIELGAEGEKALADAHSIFDRLEHLNAAVKTANESISERKRELAGANPKQLSSKLQELQNTKIRHMEENSELVAKYTATKEKKEAKTEEKEEAKRKLDEHSEEIFPKYQEKINVHLERFGAGFRICEVQPNYVGRQPNSDYALEINDETVALGSDESTDQPAFRNTLSAGDKSALALAFFLARLDLEDSLEDRIVVFDDPIASFDSGRENYTRNEMARVIHEARQGIVMSHDPDFLIRLHQRLDDTRPDGSGPMATLEIRATSSGSELAGWDINNDAKTDFFRNFAAMRDYLKGAGKVTKKQAIQAIRPALEHNLRSRFPGSLGVGQNLGHYLQQIREATEGDEIGVLKEHYSLLDDLNSYTVPHHHAASRAEAPPRIDATQLENNISLALGFMRGTN